MVANSRGATKKTYCFQKYKVFSPWSPGEEGRGLMLASPLPILTAATPSLTPSVTGLSGAVPAPAARGLPCPPACLAQHDRTRGRGCPWAPGPLRRVWA